MPTGKAGSERNPPGSAKALRAPVVAGLQDPWCPGCRTAGHLVFEAATPRIDAAGLRDTTWDVEYWCGRCDGYFGHETARPPAGIGAGMVSDAVHVHCGHAMSPAAVEPRTIGVSGDAARSPLPAAALDALLWRCRCGFELAVPDPGDAGD